MITKEKIDNCVIDKNFIVSYKSMGNITEICYAKKRNFKISTRLINKDEYVYLPTGEILNCKHIQNRSENVFQVGQSLKRLRDYINTNVIDSQNCKWVTLTYKENMTSTEKLYHDFRNFTKRARKKLGKFEYIVAMEPQGRGAWHCHCIMIFDKKAPFIPNEDIEKLWLQGFTSTKALNDIDNIGAYLTAYLGDMELNEENVKLLQSQGVDITKLKGKEIDIEEDRHGEKVLNKKQFIKGARLFMYPPNFNLYRISRGIKKPKKIYLSYQIAKEKVGSLQPTFKKAYQILDTNSKFENLYIYEYYNSKRKYKSSV